MGKEIVTLEEANALFEKGSYGRAESACRRLLRRDQNSTSALFLMALIHQEQKKVDAAIADYRKVIAIKSDIPEVYYNLGILLNESGELAEAIQCQKMVIKLKPDWADAHNNLGKAHLDRAEYDAAQVCFQRAIEIDESNPAAWLNLGSCIIKSVPHDAASQYSEVFEKAAVLNPNSGQAHQNYGFILEELGQREEAIAAFQRAIELEPENKMWRYFLDIRLGNESPGELPPEYVTGLFDSYANKFDDHLVNQLKYDTPSNLYTALFNQIEPSELERGLDILDLGCGTGLSGVLFEKHKESMVGIDLSEKMVNVAREKSIYDELIVGDMHQVMDQRPESFDLILAADVFVYVGELNRTFAAAQASVRTNGYFVFSVEKSEENGFHLGKKNRFQHSLSYLEEQISKHNFQKLLIQEQTLRKDSGQDIVGFIAVLQKA